MKAFAVALVVLSVLSSSSADALPPTIPTKFSGMANISLGPDQTCHGSAPFTFQRSESGHTLRVVLTSPPCFRSAFALTRQFQVQTTDGFGSLWLITLTPGDPGNDDGPNLHMIPSDPEIRALMLDGRGEIIRYALKARPIGPNQFEFLYTALRPRRQFR